MLRVYNRNVQYQVPLDVVFVVLPKTKHHCLPKLIDGIGEDAYINDCPKIVNQ
jgi:hypothetical protein